MPSFKSLFGGKGDKKSSAKPQGAERDAFLRPALHPGHYGHFPSQFGLYFIGRSQDKNSDYYLIGTDQNGAVQPINAVTVHKGTVKHQVTLHSGPNHGDAPLGLAGAEKLFRSMSIVALPATTSGPESNGPVNQLASLSPQKSIKYDNFNFSCATGPPDSPHQEDFEWRSDNVLRPPPGKLYERTLVRVKAGGAGAAGTVGEEEDQEEVVGRWTDDAAPEKTAKYGTFRFEGSGATGELGPYWALMAVMTLLRITQIKLEASAAADKMISAAARLTLAAGALAAA